MLIIEQIGHRLFHFLVCPLRGVSEAHEVCETALHIFGVVRDKSCTGVCELRQMYDASLAPERRVRETILCELLCNKLPDLTYIAINTREGIL